MAEIKKKRKKWFEIYSSREFKGVEIGEIPATAPEDLIGKTINVPLSNLSKEGRRQTAQVMFEVVSIKDNKPQTEVKKIEISPSSVKRVARRGKDKVDDSFMLKTKDNINLRIKPVILTKNKTTKSVLSSIRKESRAFISEKVKALTYSDIVSRIASFSFQKELKDKINKLYPVSFCQIRSIIKLKNDTPGNK